MLACAWFKSPWISHISLQLYIDIFNMDTINKGESITWVSIKKGEYEKELKKYEDNLQG